MIYTNTGGYELLFFFPELTGFSYSTAYFFCKSSYGKFPNSSVCTQVRKKFSAHDAEDTELTIAHTFTRYGQLGHADRRPEHAVGVGEETGPPGGNPQKHEENVQTPYTQGGGRIPTLNPGSARKTYEPLSLP